MRINNTDVNHLMISNSFILWFIFSVFLILATHQQAFSQAQTTQLQNLKSLYVDDLSDEQLRNFVNQFKSSGYSEAELEAELLKRNMSANEIQKLKARLEKLSIVSERFSTEKKSTNDDRKVEAESTTNPFQILIPKIFGADLFNNPKLSFEPNLKMATPLNYQLGPDDELLIDIFGYSEQSFRLKVSPEGAVRIPNVGPVQVVGLTIDQAQSKIKSKLTSLYPRMATGETSIAVNLGSIRSIKVIILGEVNLPGTYSLPSLATVFNALYASGGPNINGSFRNIKVYRNNTLISKIDVYDFLLKGNCKGNINLKDQDVIQVEPYDNRVHIKGFVKREGYFEMLATENLNQLLHFAGGFSAGAYSNRIKVIRNTGKQKRIADIEKSDFSKFIPRNGDAFMVDSILSRFENRVEITGSVFRPGYFSLDENHTLRELIMNAEGLKEDALMTRATILRKKEDNTLEMISVNLTDVTNGLSDISLKREDRIQVASKIDMKDAFYLTINGSVKNPGKYPYAENMRIEDLVILAGGLKEEASLTNIQISQRSFDVDKSNPNSQLAKIGIASLRSDLKSDSNSSYILKPNDIVTIFSLPGYQAQQEVKLNGEVMFPGTYTLTMGHEKISDLVKRAGGLTANGFPAGAILIRSKSNSLQDFIVKESKLEALKKLSKDTSETNDEIEKETKKTLDIVGIDLEKILKNPGSKEDLFLKEHDIIEIPAIQQTVLVTGQVLYPVKLRYQNGSSFRRYISQAGGFSSKALRRRAYIVYANGTAKDTRNFLLFKSYPRVKPGAELVIPVKEDKKAISPIEMVTITTSLTSLLIILSSFIKL